jgi:hypothetical protein
MNPDKKWKRYTRVGDVWVNMTKYRQMIKPTGTGCLEWTGPKHRQGYGFVGVLDQNGNRKMTVAHRVAMRIKLGQALSTGDDVKHACGNNLCVNPAHLYLRTKEETAIELTVDAKIPALAK